MCVYRELVYRHVVRCVFGVGPFGNSISGGVEDVLGVGSSKVGSKGHVEGVVYG